MRCRRLIGICSTLIGVISTEIHWLNTQEWYIIGGRRVLCMDTTSLRWQLLNYYTFAPDALNWVLCDVMVAHPIKSDGTARAGLSGEMDVTIASTLKFCICLYKEVKSSHSHGLPNLGMSP